MYLHVYDSAPRSFPWFADVLLVYADGQYKNLAWAQRHFPNARLLQCTVTGRPGVRVIDVEPGCVWPVSKAVELVQEDIKDRYRPWLYANAATWAELGNALQEAGVSGALYDRWLAQPDGVAEVPPGYQAKQYSWPEQHPVVPPGEGSQGYDVSVAWLEAVMWRPPVR